MQARVRLSYLLAFAVLCAGFPRRVSGETQITITQEYKGGIQENKPHGLFHEFGEVKPEAGLTPTQVSELKDIIESTDLAVVRDALENTIILNLYEKGSYAALLNEAETYMERYPDADPRFRSHILFHVAEALYYQGNYHEAMLQYRELMTEYSSSEVYVFSHLGLAWCLMHLGRHDEARVHFKRFSPVTVEDYVAAVYGMAINEFNDGNYQEAIRLFLDEEGYRKTPVEDIWGDLAKSLVPNNLFYKGLAYNRLGNQGMAIRYFRRVAEDYPNHPKAGRATYLVGWLSFLSDQYDQAITYFNKALDMVEDSTEIYEIRINLSQAYFNAGRIREAIQNWEAIKENWGAQIANTGLEQAYTRLAAEALVEEWSPDSIARLLEDFAQAVPTSQDLPSFQLRLAQEYYQSESYAKTMEWTSKGLSGTANEDIIKEARELRLFSLYSLERWEELVQEGKNYLEEYPDEREGKVVFVVAVGYASRGDELKETDQAQANEHFRRAIPLLEDFLASADQDNPYMQTAQDLLEYSRVNSQ